MEKHEKIIGLEDAPYCINCGEEKNLKHNEQYANGEYWTCKECEHNFFINPNQQEK